MKVTIGAVKSAYRKIKMKPISWRYLVNYPDGMFCCPMTALYLAKARTKVQRKRRARYIVGETPSPRHTIARALGLRSNSVIEFMDGFDYPRQNKYVSDFHKLGAEVHLSLGM